MDSSLNTESDFKKKATSRVAIKVLKCDCVNVFKATSHVWRTKKKNAVSKNQSSRSHSLNEQCIRMLMTQTTQQEFLSSRHRMQPMLTCRQSAKQTNVYSSQEEVMAVTSQCGGGQISSVGIGDELVCQTR